MEPAGSSIINRFFSQLGIPFVQDRSACSLSASAISVRQSSQFVDSESARRSRKRRRIRESARVPDASEACAVCQDVATGCQYGAATCGSCKEFFEQSVRGRLIYDCHFSRGCDLQLQRRNHCQGCRWDRCLEVGLVTSAVKRRRPSRNRSAVNTPSHLARLWSRHDDVDGMMGAAPDAAFDLATPRPSLPSPTTDAESGSECSGGTEDSESARKLAQDLCAGPDISPIIGAELVWSALTPIESRKLLAERLTELERSCLAKLFRWNKRRLAGDCGAGGSFGAAAANLTPILLTSALRHYLRAAWRELPASSPVVELRDRVRRLLHGSDQRDFEPLMRETDCLAAHIGGLCSRLLEVTAEQKRDVLSDVVFTMAEDRTEEETPAHPGSDGRQTLLVASSISAVADRLASAGPEQRALLLAALVCDLGAPGAAATAAEADDALLVPALFSV